MVGRQTDGSKFKAMLEPREVDLPGAENLGVTGKMGMMHPFALLLAMGMMQTAPWAAMVA